MEPLSLTCPVCGGALADAGGSFRCGAGHSFDKAKQGYVNLLLRAQSGGRRHGDDKRMVEARRAFLDTGCYAPLRDALCAMALEFTAGPVRLLDAGCGEGYYTAAVADALRGAGRGCTAVGVDISKTALIAAARRRAELTLAVASVGALPVVDGSCDLLLNIFAPESDREFARVLRPGGVLLKAVPLERHLFGLKAAVYDRPYENSAPAYAPEGFTLLTRRDVCYSAVISPREMIENLFMMTPYYYKTGAADQAKLAALDSLETELAFAVYALCRN